MRLFLINTIALLSLAANIAFSQEWKLVMDLRGQWKFELGDKPGWADQTFDDGAWDEIFVPSNWEDEGYPGYDGYAWYRKHFKAPINVRDKELYLHIGYVDDVSEVYLNGHMIGFSGSFPPDYITAYNNYQRYTVPRHYLNLGGDNVIAVRVYDAQLSGGIVGGKVGLYEAEDFLQPDVKLAGTWKFKRGDNDDWRDPTLDESKWKDILVPAFWETQGFKDYDGYGWYRLRFKVPENLRNHRLILLLGKIDDVDEAFLNGERIGRTGKSIRGRLELESSEEYLQLRAYTIPSGVLRFDQENALAVRVYDNYIHGGIYEGPIGIVTQEHYRAWHKKQPKDRKKEWNFFDFMFKD